LGNKSGADVKELALIEKSIIKTMRTFRDSPRSFWSTDDIRCYLKLQLLRGRLFKKGSLGNVFLSFPTKSTYDQRPDGSLTQSPTGKNEHFALAGWAASLPTTWNHMTQQLSFAVETEYSQAIPDSWTSRIRNDLLKLSDERNEVPARGRFLLLLTTQPTSLFRGGLNSLFEEFPSVRCYQQISQ